MKLRTIALILVVAAFVGCSTESKNCPRMVEVPFDCVWIPDSVEAGTSFIIDLRVHDFGCYQSAELETSFYYDTIYLTAYAYYDECECPNSKNLSLTSRMSLDTVQHNRKKYFFYMLVDDETRDSVRLCVDTVMFY